MPSPPHQHDTPPTERPSSSPWLLREPSADSPARLFCVPYSGCGASMYRRWPRFADGVEICPVQLPGRENRIRERPHETYQALADDLADGLLPYLDRPYGLFGHCGAALAAYETAVRLVERGYRLPTRLFLSSQVAPQDGPRGRFLGLTDAELREEIGQLTVQLGGEPVPSLIDLTLGILREDIEANKRYHLPDPPRLPVALTALGWSGDFEVPHATMGGWDRCGDTVFDVLEGEHYTFTEAPAALLDRFTAGLLPTTADRPR